MSWCTETTWLADSSRRLSRARCFGPPTDTRWASTRTSRGPRIRNSIPTPIPFPCPRGLSTDGRSPRLPPEEASLPYPRRRAGIPGVTRCGDLRDALCRRTLRGYRRGDAGGRLKAIPREHDPRLASTRMRTRMHRGTEMLLDNKNAVIYGAGGTIGGAVARAFAGEGARVFLAGRSQPSLDRVAAQIAGAGGAAETARVDVLDERAVEEHVAGVAARAGGIDISFTAIGHGDVHGTPLLEMGYEDFARPIVTAIRSQFLITSAVARQMIERRAGGDLVDRRHDRASRHPPGGRHGRRLRRDREPLPAVGRRARSARHPGAVAADDWHPRGLSRHRRSGAHLWRRAPDVSRGLRRLAQEQDDAGSAHHAR